LSGPTQLFVAGTANKTPSVTQIRTDDRDDHNETWAREAVDQVTLAREIAPVSVTPTMVREDLEATLQSTPAMEQQMLQHNASTHAPEDHTRTVDLTKIPSPYAPNVVAAQRTAITSPALHQQQQQQQQQQRTPAPTTPPAPTPIPFVQPPFAPWMQSAAAATNRGQQSPQQRPKDQGPSVAVLATLAGMLFLAVLVAGWLIFR
jgi:hypothetical protein